MRQRGFVLVIILGLLAVSASGLRAAGHYKVWNGPERFYYGHISYTEAKSDGQDPVVLREGQAEAEAAILNLPLGPGDTLRTTADRRCEIQFDTGTIVRLDFNTELKIEAVLAQSLSASTQLSNLVLSRGRIYVMYKQYDSREMFQVLTPLAAFKLSHNTVAILSAAADGSTDAQVKSGKASALFGPNEKTLQNQTLKSHDRLLLTSATQVQRGAYVAGSDFELWNDDINARFDELHKGESALPKPVQKLPPAVFYFAQRYGSTYGEWLWDDLYGYVWRPFFNRQEYPWGWAPYYYGRWSSMGGQLYWVPEEPWGWIPYHLGVWQWDKKLGWVWLPGSLFAPAWVDWEFFFGYFGWRPYGLYDWFDGFTPGFYYGGNTWNYILPGIPGTVAGNGGTPVLTSVGGNQLKQPSSTLTMPKELKSAYKNVRAAYKRGDPRVLESMKQATSQTVFVSRSSLNSPRVEAKALTWDKMPKPNGVPPAKESPSSFRKPLDARQSAAQAFLGNQAARQILRQAENPGPAAKSASLPAAAQIAASAADTVARRPARPGLGIARAAGVQGRAVQQRFLDWNPDISVARALGVRIEYSSRTNEIRCPELKLSSRDREPGHGGFVSRMTSSGVVQAPAGFAGPSGAGSSASTRTTSSGQASAKESSSSGGSGGKIKN
jgi:hypothetical protein